MRLAAIWAGCILMLGACGSPQDPVFQSELWPGEGRPQFETVGRALFLRDAPSPSGAVVRELSQRSAGTPIEFDSTRYQTLRPGHVATVRTDTITGRAMGSVRYLSREDYYSARFPSERWILAAGDTLEYLQDRAEGTCFIRFEGTLIDADPCVATMDPSFELVSEPVVQWWIRVLTDGSPQGWLLVSDSTVAVAGRTF